MVCARGRPCDVQVQTKSFQRVSGAMEKLTVIEARTSWLAVSFNLFKRLCLLDSGGYLCFFSEMRVSSMNCE